MIFCSYGVYNELCMFNRTREHRMNVGSQTRLVIRQDNEGTIHGGSGSGGPGGAGGELTE